MLSTLKGETESAYVSAARSRIEDLERMLSSDLGEIDFDRDAGWDPASLLEEVSEQMPE